MATHQSDDLIFELELAEEALPVVEAKVAPAEHRLRGTVENLFRLDQVHSKKVCGTVLCALEQHRQEYGHACSELRADSGGEEDFVAQRLRCSECKVDIVPYSLLRHDWDPLLWGKCRSPKNNKFLSVLCKNERGTREDEIIVELHFRQQFVIQNSSPRFSKFLELLPTVFVGTSRMLQQLVPMICDEMSRCFASLGQPVPPWRRIQTVKSRWTCTKPTIPKFVQESTNFRIQSVHQDQTEIRKPPSMLHYQLLMGSKKALPQHTKGHKKSRFSVLYEQNGLIFPHVAKKDIYTMIHRKNEAKGRKMHECKRVTITEAVIAHLNNGWFGVA